MRIAFKYEVERNEFDEIEGRTAYVVFTPSKKETTQEAWDLACEYSAYSEQDTTYLNTSVEQYDENEVVVEYGQIDAEDKDTIKEILKAFKTGARAVEEEVVVVNNDCQVVKVANKEEVATNNDCQQVVEVKEKLSSTNNNCQQTMTVNEQQEPVNNENEFEVMQHYTYEGVEVMAKRQETASGCVWYHLYIDGEHEDYFAPTDYSELTKYVSRYFGKNYNYICLNSVGKIKGGK
ncbi:MAG: hypothetical protein ACRCX8_14200 [Sarcina sp.]